ARVAIRAGEGDEKDSAPCATIGGRAIRKAEIDGHGMWRGSKVDRHGGCTGIIRFAKPIVGSRQVHLEHHVVEVVFRDGVVLCRGKIKGWRYGLLYVLSASDQCQEHDRGTRYGSQVTHRRSAFVG